MKHFLKQIVACIVLFCCFSCQKNNELQPAKIIDFPAAYVVCGDNTISVINLSNFTVDTSFNIPNNGASFAHHIYKSPDNGQLVVAMPRIDLSNGHGELHSKTVEGGVVTMNAKTGRLIKQTSVPYVNHNAVFSPDGSEIWTALMSHNSPRVVVYNAQTLRVLKEINVGTDASEVSFSTDGGTAFVAAQESSFVYAIDVATKEVVKQIKVDVYPTNVWPGDGLMYVENKYKKSINILDSETLRATTAIDLDFLPGFITFDNRNQNLWVCHPAGGEVVLLNEKSGNWTSTTRIRTGADAHAIAYSDKFGVGLVVNQRANTVSVIDLSTSTKIKDIIVGKKPNGIVLIE